jgi:hypothetical protein
MIKRRQARVFSRFHRAAQPTAAGEGAEAEAEGMVAALAMCLHIQETTEKVAVA